MKTAAWAGRRASPWLTWLDLVAAAEFHVAELLRDTQGGRVVGAQLSSGALQIEVVEEVAVEGQRGVPAVSLSPLIRIDDEVLEVRAGRALDSTHPRSGKPVPGGHLYSDEVAALMAAFPDVRFVISHLARGSIWDARTSGGEFFKIFLYYMALLSWVDSPSRMRKFLLWLCLCLEILIVFALLQYVGTINLPALSAIKYLRIPHYPTFRARSLVSRPA